MRLWLKTAAIAAAPAEALVKASWLILGTGILYGSLTSCAEAAEYKSVAEAAAVFYDAPSEKGRKTFLVPRGTPLEVIVTYGEWSKVRDVSSDLAWVPSRTLGGPRHVMATKEGAAVRNAPDEQAPVLFTVDQGVLLELLKPGPAGWLTVRHRDGDSGYISASDVWGD